MNLTADMSNKQTGFSLMELMIVVAIVGILAAIAYPSYQSQVLRTKRTAAKTALSSLATEQEQFRGNRKRYASTLSELGYGASTLYLDGDGNLETSSSSASIYAISLTAYGASTTANCSSSGSAGSHSYTLKATPQGSQSADGDCANLCLAHTGERGSSAGDPKDCW